MFEPSLVCGQGAPASASPFGGGAAGAFGQPAGALGAGGQGGTGNPPYRVIQERESMPGAPGQVQAFNYMAICKMTEYAHKSFEELRFEDYQKGNKGTAAAATTAFGAAAPSPAPGFGAAPSPFGGAANASPFGGAAPGAAPAFGAAPTPFGKPYAATLSNPAL